LSRILITGSTDGVGRATAASLVDDGHEVVVHARSDRRLDAVEDLVARGAASVVGDLAEPAEVQGIAEQANRIGSFDAVVHNAGIIDGPALLPVNVVAPYALTALIPASRLVYLSSSMHRGGRVDLAGADWSGARTTASYSDSKLFATALGRRSHDCGRTCSPTRSTPDGSPRRWVARRRVTTSPSPT
jgi:nucleoside-diphosphate-sugar epimerase